MYQKDLARKVAIKTNWELYRVEQVIDAVFEEIGNAMLADNTVYIKNFGSFFSKECRFKKKAMRVEYFSAVTCKMKFSKVFGAKFRKRANIKKEG